MQKEFWSAEAGSVIDAPTAAARSGVGGSVSRVQSTEVRFAGRLIFPASPIFRRYCKVPERLVADRIAIGQLPLTACFSPDY